MKKSELSMLKIAKNNLHMIGTVYHADAGYTGFTLLVRIISAVRTSFLYVYLLGMVLYCVENRKEIEVILLLLLSVFFSLLLRLLWRLIIIIYSNRFTESRLSAACKTDFLIRCEMRIWKILIMQMLILRSLWQMKKLPHGHWPSRIIFSVVLNAWLQRVR